MIGYQSARYKLTIPFDESIKRYNEMADKYLVLAQRYDNLIESHLRVYKSKESE